MKNKTIKGGNSGPRIPSHTFTEEELVAASQIFDLNKIIYLEYKKIRNLNEIQKNKLLIEINNLYNHLIQLLAIFPEQISLDIITFVKKISRAENIPFPGAPIF